MIKPFTVVAALGVVSIPFTRIADAQIAQGQPGDVDSPGEQAVPPAPSSAAQPSDHLDSARLPTEAPASAAVNAGLASPYAISPKVVPGLS